HRGQGHERLEVVVDEPVERPEAREAEALRSPRPLQHLVPRRSRDRRREADSHVHRPKATGRREGRGAGCSAPPAMRTARLEKTPGAVVTRFPSWSKPWMRSWGSARTSPCRPKGW